jgi:hypothetical protein
VLTNRIRFVHLDVWLVGLGIRFNATGHRSSVFTFLQNSCSMLCSCWSGASLLVSTYALISPPHLTNATFSFFSSLFTATKNFPSLIGIVSAASMVMYGLSPLFFSFFATNFFTDPRSGLDFTGYLTFLAFIAGTVNLFGACVLTVPDNDVVPEMADDETETTIDETTSLLSGPRKCDEDVHAIVVREPDEISVTGLVKDPYFWILFVFMAVTVGCVSMFVFPRQ